MRAGSGSSSVVGIRNGTSEVLMRCFARLIRWAIVASGDQERARDLRRGQAADRAQGERDRRRRA